MRTMAGSQPRAMRAPHHPQRGDLPRLDTFLRLFPAHERRILLCLFRAAADGQLHPEGVLDAVKVGAACLWLDPAFLNAEELLAAKRASVLILKYPHLALWFTAELLSQAARPPFDDSSYDAEMKDYQGEQAAAYAHTAQTREGGRR